MNVTRLGLGCAQLGNLYRAMPEENATATVERAWAEGIRYFDTAPHYGLGLSERRLGTALAACPRAEFVISTKVGRLGLDRVDIVYVHDPDDHWTAALDEALPALTDLRAQGVIGAVGVGMNQCPMLAEFVRHADLDVLMVAGRYTLLDQPALDELLPLCARRGVAVMALPAAHPAVAGVVVGAQSPEQVSANVGRAGRPVPGALWAELIAEGLLRPDTVLEAGVVS